jgi:hypothetical protein
MSIMHAIKLRIGARPAHFAHFYIHKEIQHVSSQYAKCAGLAPIVVNGKILTGRAPPENLTAETQRTQRKTILYLAAETQRMHLSEIKSADFTDYTDFF